VQQTVRHASSRTPPSAKWHAGVATSSLLVASAAALLSGCTATDGMMSSVAVPPAQTTQGPSEGQDPPLPAPPGAAGTPPSKLVVTGQQRAYLDALVAAGVRPSSDLLALSIGSYVCQARAAGQSENAVWDFVHPLVDSDVHNARRDSPPPTPSDVDDATATYIRIATERLC
jgi:type IV pilus biogenesis protein CpaD/CtpE